MKILVFVLAAASLASAAPFPWHHHHHTPGQPVPGCKHPVELVKTTTTGEIIEGPVCVQTNVNAIRYNTVIKRTVTETAGQDLFGALSKPPAPITIADATPAGGQSRDSTHMAALAAQDTLSRSRAMIAARQGDDPIGDSFRATRTLINNIDVLLAFNQKQARDAQTTIDQEILVLKAVVTNSDAVFQGGAKNLIASAQAAIAGFRPVTWPDVEDTLAQTNNAIQALNALHQMDGWGDWYKANSQDYDKTAQKADDQKTAATAIAPASDPYKTASQQLAVIQQWTQFINSLNEGMFLETEDVPCGILFNVTRTNTLQLSQTDRLPTLDLNAMTTNNVDSWVVVRCSNPFTVSAGMVFSFVADNEFGIVPSKGPNDSSGNPTLVNQFQTTSTSNVPKLPIVLAHARLHDFWGDKIALHGSFGVAAHTRSDAQGGSNPEYLLGGSLSLLRTMFITGGPYWATRVQLAGGFSPGDTVPSSVSTPPLRKDGVRGWALAISFTKP